MIGDRYIDELDQAEIQGVVGLMDAIHAWHFAYERAAHDRTQGWLDEFVGQVSQAQVDMLITKQGAQAVAGLICAIHAWRECSLSMRLIQVEGARAELLWKLGFR